MQIVCACMRICGIHVVYVCVYIYYVLMIFMGFVCIILYIHNCASQTARVVRYCTWLPSQFVPVQPRSHLEALAMLPGLKSFFGESGYLEKLENALSLHCGLEDWGRLMRLSHVDSMTAGARAALEPVDALRTTLVAANWGISKA